MRTRRAAPLRSASITRMNWVVPFRSFNLLRPSRRRARVLAAVACAALLWQALLPLSQAARGLTGGAMPGLVTLCTAAGLRVLPVPADDGPVAAMADHCVLCRLAVLDAAPGPRAQNGMQQRAALVPPRVALVAATLAPTWPPASARAPPAA